MKKFVMVFNIRIKNKFKFVNHLNNFQIKELITALCNILLITFKILLYLKNLFTSTKSNGVY